jgi:hypothetical protein
MRPPLLLHGPLLSLAFSTLPVRTRELAKYGLKTGRTFHHVAINACLIFLLDLLLHAWLQLEPQGKE